MKFLNFGGQCCGSSAWELAVRWSDIDLNSPMADSLGPAAGDTDIYALRWQVEF